MDNKSALDTKYAKKYSSSVLYGNWFEERILEENQAKQAKSTKGQDECTKDRATAVPVPLKKGTRLNSIRAGRGKESVKTCLMDGEEYLDNMTSLYDLSYRLKEKGNLMKSYGSLTHFGLKDWYTCIRNRSDCSCVYSESRMNYKCPDRSALQMKHFAPSKVSSIKANQPLAQMEGRTKSGFVPDDRRICVI